MSKTGRPDEGPDLSQKATLERLQVWLDRHFGPKKEDPADRHGPPNVSDLRLVENMPGWLWEAPECTCTCPPYDGVPMHYPAGQPHHHTYNVRGVLTKTYRLRGASNPLSFWKYVRDHRYLPWR